jgi:hypothetical protein
MNEAQSSTTLEVSRERQSSSADNGKLSLGRWSLLTGFASKARGLIRVPLLSGFRKLIIARGEVRRGLAELNLGSSEASASDFLIAQDIPRAAAVAPHDRELARIDQDGFAFALDPRDQSLFPGRERELPRKRYHIDIVLRAGKVCARKRFGRQSIRKTGLRNWWWNLLGLPFYTEAASLLRLRDCPGVPLVREIDVRSRTIYMSYIRGMSLRHHVAINGPGVHDLEIQNDPDLRRLSNEALHERECALFNRCFGSAQKEPIKELIHAMNERGVVVLDTKLGNVIIADRSKSPYWVDFERAHLKAFPGWNKKLREQYQLLNRSFDLAYDLSE